MEEINSVIIVGGGDNGLMAALILRMYHPEIAITVVDDPDRAIMDVGKSTTNTFRDILHDDLGIETDRFVEEVRPIWKTGIFFADWCDRESFHLPFDEGTLQPREPSKRRFNMLYARHRDNNFRSLCVELTERGLTPIMREQGTLQDYGFTAYHLNTNRFNAFLRDICAERDIDIIDDAVTTVDVADDRITRVAGSDSEYHADLYIDASGFERALVRHLETELVGFDYPIDSALVTTVDVSLSEIEPATVVRSGDYGWFWQIDTYDCRDLGYVYASDFVSDEDAVAEFVDAHDGVFTEEEVAQYRFQSGVHEKAWVSNCLAVGNALGFVEPLLSTALSANAQLCKKVFKLLAGHGRINHAGLRETVNQWVAAVWNDIYDINSLTYRHSTGENEFWAAMETVGDAEGVARYLDPYHSNGFSSYDQTQAIAYVYPRYLMYRLIRGLGVRSAFYENLDAGDIAEAERFITEHEEFLTEQVEKHLSYDEFYAVLQ